MFVNADSRVFSTLNTIASRFTLKLDPRVLNACFTTTFLTVV